MPVIYFKVQVDFAGAKYGVSTAKTWRRFSGSEMPGLIFAVVDRPACRQA